MALKEQINAEMKAALLGGDRFVGETLRNLKAAILNEEVARNQREEGLGDEDVEKVIAREVKKRTESAKLYRENDRPELAEPEEQEMEVLKRFLPQQIGEDELRSLVAKKIATLGVSGPQAIGRVIGALKQELGNTVDGVMLARIVKEQL